MQQAYAEHDLPMLRAIAEALAIELPGATARHAAAALASQMLAGDFALQVAAALPSDAQAALQNLLVGAPNGRPAAAFARQFGALRPLGVRASASGRTWHPPMPARPCGTQA